MKFPPLKLSPSLSLSLGPCVRPWPTRKLFHGVGWRSCRICGSGRGRPRRTLDCASRLERSR